MPLSKPYKRCIRPFVEDNSYSLNGKGRYIQHPKYAKNALAHIRAFDLIQKDLLDIFDYVDPSDINLKTYSFRIHALLVRVCIEIESNFVSILNENNFTRSQFHIPNQYVRADFRKINKTHHLSEYAVRYPVWYGEEHTIKPFQKWSEEQEVEWHLVYNQAKHQRARQFHEVTFGSLIQAFAGLVAVLTSQFIDNSFSPGNVLIAFGKNNVPDNMIMAIGDYCMVSLPEDWDDSEKYDFDSGCLSSDESAFQDLEF